MKRTKQIRQAVIDLNFSKVEHEIDKQELTATIPTEVLTIVKQTGALLLRRSNPHQEGKRDRFTSDLNDWFSRLGADDAQHQLKKHRQDVEVCERAFREILVTLAGSPPGRTSPEVASWGALRGVAADIMELSRSASHGFGLIRPRLAYGSSNILRVDAFGAHDLDPDGVAECYANDLGGYLKMLGHLHGWFVGDLLTLPAGEPASSELISDRSAMFLAESWNQLEDHWGRLQYFENSSARLEERSYTDGELTRRIDTVVFDHDWQYFRDIEIARSRLRRQVFEVAMHVIASPKTASAIADPALRHVDVFPRGLISIHEAASMLALDMCYGLRLAEDQNQYLGLRLGEWLRGYALLQLCCERQIAVSQIADGICYLDVPEFVSLAGNAGMARERTLEFIKQITFQRNSRDLYDTPLIRTADDRYIILSCLITHAAIHEILTSRINSLLLQVEKKGLDFEREVREIFERLGAAAKRIEYRTSEGNFECDAAVLWDKDLFLCECKAYTLPRSSPGDLFFFRRKQEDAANQIRRIARHMKEDPTILNTAFGATSEVARTTLCVINLAPFASAGADRDVKVFDIMALQKFNEGKIEAVIRGPEGRGAASPIATLWAGDLPTPGDLLQHMDRPCQYLAETEKWTVEEIDIPLSSRLIMASPILKQRPDSLSDITDLIERNQTTLKPMLRGDSQRD